MHHRLTILATLFYLTVVFYHPLVMIGHMGMHVLQVNSHQSVHEHHHHDGEEKTFHIHGETETKNLKKNLVQVILQCLPPMVVAAPKQFAFLIDKDFRLSHSYFAYYPNRHTPPPEV